MTEHFALHFVCHFFMPMPARMTALEREPCASASHSPSTHPADDLLMPVLHAQGFVDGVTLGDAFQHARQVACATAPKQTR